LNELPEAATMEKQKIRTVDKNATLPMVRERSGAAPFKRSRKSIGRVDQGAVMGRHAALP
jgi:hypothetical protein